jgi:type IV secretion system protein TrbB
MCAIKHQADNYPINNEKNKLSESNRRLYEKLYKDLGSDIANFLQDSDINEIMLNPDGNLWVDSATRGQSCVGKIGSSQAYAILNSVAGINNFVISQYNPRLEAELPFYEVMKGERVTGQIPPIVSTPCFTIRKKAGKIYALDDYVASNRATQNQTLILKKLVTDRKNILICGGPGSGKTTVTNALIIEAVRANPSQRFVILEDLPELQCTAQNKVSFLTTDDIDMTALLRAAMRMRPDRILVGEVRGKEALDMLKAWNTGCPGGICTVHANSTEEAVQRILDLAMEAGVVTPPKSLVLHTIDAIVSVTRIGSQKGFIEKIVNLKEYQNERYIFEELA